MILTFLLVVAFVYSFLSGGITNVSNSALGAGKYAIDLFVTIAGSMAVWGGVMKLSEASGLNEKLSCMIRPLIKKIFRGLKDNSPALSAIAMNITANLFGLGNAATPLGIEAMRALEKEESCGETASLNMVLLTVFNTSSIELIPTTVAAIRLSHGCTSAFDILPCVLAVSFASLGVSLFFAYFLNGIKGRR